MRLVLYTGILLFIFGIAWVLYLDNQNKKFIENLSQPPERQSLTTSDDSDQREDVDIQREDVDIHKIYATEHSEDLIPDPPHVRPHPAMTRSAPDYAANVSPTLGEKMLAKKQETLDEKQDEVFHLSDEFDREKIRQGLIHEFGDIPEVDIFMQNMPPNIKDGQIVKGQTFTSPADALEHKKAVATLWPTPENLRSLERTKELMEWGGGPLPDWIDPAKVQYQDKDGNIGPLTPEILRDLNERRNIYSTETDR